MSHMAHIWDPKNEEQISTYVPYVTSLALNIYPGVLYTYNSDNYNNNGRQLVMTYAVFSWWSKSAKGSKSWVYGFVAGIHAHVYLQKYIHINTNTYTHE